MIKAVADPPTTNRDGTLMKLTANVISANSLCMTNNNVFYSDGANKLYAAKKGGQVGGIAMVTEVLSNARGCAYDNDGTVLFNKFIAFSCCYYYCLND